MSGPAGVPPPGLQVPPAPQPGIPWRKVATLWATVSSCSWSRARCWSQEVKQGGQDMQCGKPPLEPRAHAWHLSPEMPSLQQQVPVCGSQLGEMEPWGSQAQAVGEREVQGREQAALTLGLPPRSLRRRMTLCEYESLT